MYFAFIKLALFGLLFWKQHMDEPLYCYLDGTSSASASIPAITSQCYGLDNYTFVVYNETEVNVRYRGAQKN